MIKDDTVKERRRGSRLQFSWYQYLLTNLYLVEEKEQGGLRGFYQFRSRGSSVKIPGVKKMKKKKNTTAVGATL